VQTRLMNTIARHEFRKLKPNVTGPRVPVENLKITGRSFTRARLVCKETGDTHDTMFMFAENQMKNILLN